jgi:hypothetical protein
MPSPRKTTAPKNAEEPEVKNQEVATAENVAETNTEEVAKEQVIEEVVDTTKAEEVDTTAEVVETGKEDEVDETETQKAKEDNPKEAKVSEKIAPVEEEAIAEAVAPKQKLYRIKFLENHEFYVGIEKHSAKKGDVLEVELHLANLFGQRKIAYMLS